MSGTMTTMMRLDDVTAATGLGRTSIYALMGEGAFPRSYQLSARAVGWRSDEVAAWIDSRTRTPQPGPKTATASESTAGPRTR